MTSLMDDQIIHGSGSAPQVNGFENELAGGTADTAVTTWDEAVSKFTALVDGENSYVAGDLVTIMRAELFKYLVALYSRIRRRDETAGFGVGASVQLARGRLPVSARFSANAGSSGDNAKSRYAVVAKTAYPGANAVAPVWRGLQLIVDPYSLAREGQTRMTAVMFWNFKVLRETGLGTSENPGPCIGKDVSARFASLVGPLAAWQCHTGRRPTEARSWRRSHRGRSGHPRTSTP